MVQSDDPRAADVFDFVDAYAAAQERGEDPPLAHWLARFPASQEAVAHEWLALRRGAEPAALGASPSPRAAPAADRIGPYRLIRELGRGGQGAVFLAEDTRILRRVALKVLGSRFDTIRDDKLRRFRREAEIIARLEHPSLCTVYEADLEGEQPYIAMRFVEGRTLAEVLTEARRSGDASEAVQLDTGDDSAPRASLARFPPRTKLELDGVLFFFERAARALHAAHEAGVVHRDVKPGNVIVATDGRPVILDFGLAREESEGDAARITESGEVFGTPAYMSPEQLDSRSDELDRRTDVYSLGVALYEALTLHRPFEQAARPALYLAIQSQPAPDPRTFHADLSEDVAVLLATALEKDRARRYPTALDLAEDLRRIRQYEPIRARPAGVGLRFARWIRRHPALASATIGTILSLSAGLAVALDLLGAERAALQAKDQALGEKDAALAVALGKHLAQRSIELAKEDAAAALALGILGAERAPGYQTLSALYPALENCWIERELPGDDSFPMTALAIDPTGRYVIGAFNDGVALVWEAATGAQAGRITPGAGAIDVLAIDPAGGQVALSAVDGTIALARLPDGEIQARVATGQRATRLEFSRDGARLLARAATGVVRLLDPRRAVTVAESSGPHTDARFGASGRVLLFGVAGLRSADLRLVGTERPWTALAACTAFDVAPDGSWFARGLESGEIEARDERGDLLARASSPDGLVRQLSIAPHGRRAALVCGADPQASLWIWSPDAAPVALGITGRRASVRFAWSPDGERVAVSTGDTTVRVCDARSGALERAYTLQKRQTDAVWTPDGARLVTATSGFAYVLFARARPDTFDLPRHAGAVRALRLAPDGERLLSASADGTAHLASLRDATAAPQVFAHGAPLLDAHFAASGALILTAGEDGVVRAFDSATAACVAAAEPLSGGIAALVTDEASARAAVVGRDGTALMLDAASGAVRSVATALGGASRATSAAFLDGGARLAFGTHEGAVVVLDVETLEPLVRREFGRPDAPARAIVALDASPAGELAIGCADRFVRFWIPGPAGESRPERFVFHLRGLAWSPRGDGVLALGLEPGPRAVRVLLAATGDPQAPHNAHRGAITCAAFADDGSGALSGASDGSVFSWSARDGAPLVQRTELGASVASVAFARTRAGPSAAAGLADGSVRVWPLDPLSAARARRPRALADWELKRERKLADPLPFD
ncbi:MAG: protein kinase [Planctomycetes bacterium]|nr:protein kinase [Planctomycetota bacterium]